MHPYDLIAPHYDGAFRTAEALAEDRRVVSIIGYHGGSVLDIGCGTGLLLDHITPDYYVGIDPSYGMLSRLIDKHPSANVYVTTLEGYRTDLDFDLIVGLYGAPSYCAPDALQRIPSMLSKLGRYFLMFYAPGYVPVTYQRVGITVPHHKHSPDILPGTSRILGNYLVIEGTRAQHEALSQAERVRGGARSHSLAV